MSGLLPLPHAFSLLALDVSTLSLHIGSESESKEKKTGIFFFSSTSCQRRSQTQKSQKCSFHSTATVSRRVCCAVTLSSASQLSSPHTHTHTHTHTSSTSSTTAGSGPACLGLEAGQPSSFWPGPSQRSSTGGPPALAAAVPLQDNCWRARGAQLGRAGHAQ